MSQAVVGHRAIYDQAVVRMPARRYLLTTIQVDGVIRYRLPILREMVRRGWEVHVAAPCPETLTYLEKQNIFVHEVQLDRGSTNPIQEIRTLRNFRAISEKVNPDLSHHFSTKAVIYGCITGRGINVATVTGLGYSLSGARSGLRNLPVRLTAKRLYRRAMKNCDHVIFQNEHDCQIFIDQGIAQKSQASVVPGSGIDMNYFHPSKVRPRRGPVRFVVLSRMLRSKGIEDFATAARTVLQQTETPCEFVLAGPLDAENPSCVKESQIRAWEDEGIVKWMGPVDDAIEAYAEADVAVLPSFYNEGLSRSLVEGAAMGLPLITTDNPGCREAVNQGVSGFVVPLRNPERLADAMMKLVEDPSLRKSMGVQSRIYVEKRFSLENVLERILRTYDSVLTHGGKAGID